MRLFQSNDPSSSGPWSSGQDSPRFPFLLRPSRLGPAVQMGVVDKELTGLKSQHDRRAHEKRSDGKSEGAWEDWKGAGRFERVERVELKEGREKFEAPP